MCIKCSIKKLMKKVINLLLIIGIILLQQNICFAQENRDVVVNKPNKEVKRELPEPIFIEETLPNEKGEWELEVHVDYFENNSSSIVALPEFQVLYGLTKNLELEISLPFVYSKIDQITNYGLRQFSTGLKWRFLKQSSILPALVAGIEVEFPVNSSSDEKQWEYAPRLAFLKELCDFCFHGNLSYSIEHDSNNETEHRQEFNLAAIYPVFDEKLDVMGEFSAVFGSDFNEQFVSPGLRYYIADEVDIGFALPLDFNDSDVVRFLIEFQMQF